MSNLTIGTCTTIDEECDGKVLVDRHGGFEVIFGGRLSSSLTIQLTQRAARSMVLELSDAIRKFDAGLVSDDEG